MSHKSGSPKTSPASTKEEILSHIAGPERDGLAPLRLLTRDSRLEEELGVDALAVDPAGRPVLIFFGPRDEEPWLLSILDSLSWIAQHRGFLADRFPNADLSEDLPPKVVLIAPDFPKRLLFRLQTLDSLDLDLWEAGWIELSGERRVGLRRLEARASDPQGLPPWALDPKAATLLRDAAGKLGKLDPEIRMAWGPGRLEVLYRGRLLAFLAPQAQALRFVIPGEPRLDERVAEPSQCLRQMDLVLRRYLEAGLDEKPILKESPASAEKAEGPKLPAGRALLTAEEIEAIAK